MNISELSAPFPQMAATRPSHAHPSLRVVRARHPADDSMLDDSPTVYEDHAVGNIGEVR
jgi:hypothetical protein